MAASDLIMPEIGERDLARRLLKQHPMMKPLFVSGYEDEAMVSRRLNPPYILRWPYRQLGWWKECMSCWMPDEQSALPTYYRARYPIGGFGPEQGRGHPVV